jgi:pyruvate kinase
MKILPTIGPASESIKALKKISKYVSIFRVNGSHNTLEWHHKVINNLKKINKNNQILMDVPGVKPRTDNIKDLYIKKNTVVDFYYKNIHQCLAAVRVPLTHPIPKISFKQKYFTISDGMFSFEIVKIKKNLLRGISKQDFYLKSRKGLNIPNSVYDNTRQLKISLQFMNKIKELNIDAIGLSFVQNEVVIKIIKKKYPNYLIVSKIENTKGLANVKNIIKFSDIVMIDRGDLSAEIGQENLFSALVNISQECKNNGKPLIMATENLESMMNQSNPTKSEIISLAFSDYIKTDLIMLSDETATSKNYLKIIKWLQNFINISNRSKCSKIEPLIKNNFWDILKDFKKIGLVIFTKKGYAIDESVRINKNLDLFIFSDSKKLIKQCNFRSNCMSFLTKKFPKKMETFIYKHIKKNSSLIFKDNLEVLLIYVSYPIANSRANTFSIISKKIFH